MLPVRLSMITFTRCKGPLFKEIAEKGNCVIVGRCADYILCDRDDVLNVFIHGNEPEKCKRIMELYNKSETDALAFMKEYR